MNDEELRMNVEEIKAQVKAKPENKDKSDDEIDEILLEGYFKAYTDGKLSKDDLENIIGSMGYEFTEEFKNEPEAKDEFSGEADAEGMSKEELEDTRTIGEGESKEEFKEKIDEAKDEEIEDDDDAEDDDEEMSEEDERKKASDLWKMNLNK